MRVKVHRWKGKIKNPTATDYMVITNVDCKSALNKKTVYYKLKGREVGIVMMIELVLIERN